MSIFDAHKDGIVPEALKATKAVDIKTWQAELMQALESNEAYTAYRVYKQLPQAQAKSHLPADAVYPLGQYLATEQKGEEVLILVEGFSKRFAGHKDVVNNYLLVARVMATQLGERAQAQALLQRLSTHYSEHADFSKIKALQMELGLEERQ